MIDRTPMIASLLMLVACAEPMLDGAGVDDKKAGDAEFCASHPGHSKCPAVSTDPVEVQSATFWTMTYSEGAGSGNLVLDAPTNNINGSFNSVEAYIHMWGAVETSPNTFTGTGAIWICNDGSCSGADLFHDDSATITYTTAVQSNGWETLTNVSASGTESGVAYSLTTTSSSVDGYSSELYFALSR